MLFFEFFNGNWIYFRIYHVKTIRNGASKFVPIRTKKLCLKEYCILDVVNWHPWLFQASCLQPFFSKNTGHRIPPILLGPGPGLRVMPSLASSSHFLAPVCCGPPGPNCWVLLSRSAGRDHAAARPRPHAVVNVKYYILRLETWSFRVRDCQ